MGIVHRKTLALILAGGRGNRLEVLTENRAKPAMPYAGVYRLIDFSLSNCMHSGLSDVWVIEQYQPHSLNEHLANGRPWDLDRTYGGLQVLPPYENRDGGESDGGGFAEGNADAIYRHRNFIREFAPDLLLILSADHIYKLDYSDVIARHLESEADVTIVTVQVSPEDASRYGLVKVNGRGRVTGFAYKPEKPESDLAAAEIFVYNAPNLLDALDQLVGEADGKGEAFGGSGSLKDFGHELIPKLVADGRAYEYRHEGYWRDVGTVESYWKSHMDLLAVDSPLTLDDPRWPILTYGSQMLPARVHESARIENSMISPGCTIRGRVERSVLGPGVVVEEGAVVRDSILLHKVSVRAGAKVGYAILDEGVIVGRRAVVGRQKRPRGKEHTHEDPSADEITLVGQRVKISEGARVPVGARAKPSAHIRRKG